MSNAPAGQDGRYFYNNMLHLLCAGVSMLFFWGGGVIGIIFFIFRRESGVEEGNGRGGWEGCRFTEIIGRVHRLHRALKCTKFEFMFGFRKFCLKLRFSTV